MPKVSFAEEEISAAPSEGGSLIEVNRIHDDPITNVRSADDEPAAIAIFSEQLRSEGLAQPILVRPDVNGGYLIIAGRRRLRAWMRAFGENSAIPAHVRNVDDATARSLAFSENHRRKQFSPIDYAMLFLEARAAVNGDKNWSEKVSRQFGVSRATVTETIKMYEGLAGDQELIDQVHSGALAADAAILLAKTRGEERQQQLQTAQALAEAEEARKPARKPRKGVSEPAEPKELAPKEGKQAKVRAKHVRAAAQAAGQPILGILKRDELLAGLQHLIVPEAPPAMNGFLDYATTTWASGKGTMMELERRWQQIESYSSVPVTIPDASEMVKRMTGKIKKPRHTTASKKFAKKKKSPKSRPPAKKPASKPAKSRKK